MALLCAAGPVAAGPQFTPVAVPEHRYDGGWEHFVGGGLAVFDCSGDGLPELFAAGGANPAHLLRNLSKPGGDIRLVADTPSALALTGVTGAYPLDLDSDGRLDLAVLRVGENLLLRGGPECSFAPFADLTLGPDARWSTAFSATWEAEQTLPTLAIGNYVDRDDPKGPFRACDVNWLYRPTGPAYGAPVALSPGFCPLSMLFTDWSDRGRADLRISNDRHYYVDGGQEQMWQMTDPPRLYTEADGWRAHRLWGMGIATRDLDRDGRDEVFLTSMADQRLQRLALPDRPAFDDVPFEMGTTAHRPYVGDDGRPSTGWHVAFGDVDNDGRDDIFITKGNVEQMPDSAMEDPNNLLMQLADGSFDEAGRAAGLASTHRGRGGALVDLNGDGRLDVAVVNRRAPLEVWQNVSPGTGHWLSVDLRQDAPNTRAVGARIELDDGTDRPFTREIIVGGGHAGGAAVSQHFGLGSATRVRLRVRWPDGARSDWIDTDTDRALILRRTDPGGALAVER